jgi:hypothetical protein
MGWNTLDIPEGTGIDQWTKRDDASKVHHVLLKAVNGKYIKTVPPLAKNAKGQYELIMGIIYNEEGTPIELQLASCCAECGGVGYKIAPTAEWEPMQPL